MPVHWSWHEEELKPEGVQFTAKVFRTSTCLADLFASRSATTEWASSDPAVELVGWNMGSGGGKLRVRVGWSDSHSTVLK